MHNTACVVCGGLVFRSFRQPVESTGNHAGRYRPARSQSSSHSARTFSSPNKTPWQISSSGRPVLFEKFVHRQAVSKAAHGSVVLAQVFAPIAARVPCEEFERGLSCLAERGQCAGRGQNYIRTGNRAIRWHDSLKRRLGWDHRARNSLLRGTPARAVHIYKDGGTSLFARRYIGATCRTTSLRAYEIEQFQDRIEF